MFADQAELDLPSEEEIKATGADAPDSLQYKARQGQGWGLGGRGAAVEALGMEAGGWESIGRLLWFTLSGS